MNKFYSKEGSISDDPELKACFSSSRLPAEGKPTVLTFPGLRLEATGFFSNPGYGSLLDPHRLLLFQGRLFVEPADPGKF